VSTRPALPSGPYLVVGLARSGVAAALALRAQGQQVVGVDAAAPSTAAPLADSGIQVHTDQDGLALLEHARAVVKSPGVPTHAPVIAAARARGLPVLGELELAWRLLGNEFIAVTGTNGKTTTVEWIGHIHRKAGLPVAVAGNVGTALSTLIGTLDEHATIVCEASSFQLEDTVAFAPDAAVLLNLTPDHLDRHGTLDDYLNAKLQLFARQRNDDIAVAPSALLQPGGPVEIEDLGGCARRVTFGRTAAAALSERAGQLWWLEQQLLAPSELRLRGAHNVENAMAAAAVCLARGIDPDAVRAGLRTFTGVAHRLEEVARRDGVLYVNDSKATNVASTLVALAALDDGARRRIHLILGGQCKAQDFSALRAPIERACGAVYLIGQDAPVIADALAGIATPLHQCGTLQRAVAEVGAAAAGTIVLLSPGCASFDQFDDFEARGEEFRRLVLGG
jgi:UDP-N-acetylmuramoylalanine--D-glutamate ligase